MDKKTVLLTFPATKPQKRCLRLGAAEAETSMSAFMRDAIGAPWRKLDPILPRFGRAHLRPGEVSDTRPRNPRGHNPSPTLGTAPATGASSGRAITEG